MCIYNGRVPDGVDRFILVKRSAERQTKSMTVFLRAFNPTEFRLFVPDEHE